MVLNFYLNSYKIHKMRINSSECTIPSINKTILQVSFCEQKDNDETINSAQLIKFS